MTFIIGVDGVKFPATEVPSADPNTLTDYQVNTWTPVLSFGGASVGITYGTQLGRYTKVGRKVTLHGRIALSNKGSSTGAAMVTGLPFTVVNNAAAYSPASIHIEAITFASFPSLLAMVNTTTMEFYECTTGGVVTTLTNADFANASAFSFVVTYEAA